MNVPPAALLNKTKKNFLGLPAPLGYVAGVGRGWVYLILSTFSWAFCIFTSKNKKLLKFIHFWVPVTVLHTVPGQCISRTCLISYNVRLWYISTNYSFTWIQVNTNWIRTIVDNKYIELVGIDLYSFTCQFLTENKKITHNFNTLSFRPWHLLKLSYALAYY